MGRLYHMQWRTYSSIWKWKDVCPSFLFHPHTRGYSALCCLHRTRILRKYFSWELFKHFFPFYWSITLCAVSTKCEHYAIAVHDSCVHIYDWIVPVALYTLALCRIPSTIPASTQIKYSIWPTFLIWWSCILIGYWKTISARPLFPWILLDGNWIFWWFMGHAAPLSPIGVVLFARDDGAWTRAEIGEAEMCTYNVDLDCCTLLDSIIAGIILAWFYLQILRSSCARRQALAGRPLPLMQCTLDDSML